MSAPLAALADALHAFARLGPPPLVPREVDHALLVRLCLAELRPSHAGRAVEVTAGPLPPCRGDPVLLKAAWAALLSNAVKFTRGREPARIEVGVRDTADGPAYFVKDDGVGFDTRQAGRLFGAFRRLHRAEGYEGAGVGLAAVRRIVHRHGGRVWAEASPGEGAIFYFTVGECRG